MSKSSLAAVLSVLTLIASPAAWANLGEPDPTFGDAGLVLVTQRQGCPSCPVITKSVAQADGSVIALVRFAEANFTRNTRIERRLPDGSLDAAYRNGGTDTLPGHEGREVFMAGSPGGKIVVASGDPNHVPLLVTRLNGDGTPDPTFGTNGTVAVGPSLFMQQLLVQPDGSVVVFAASNVAAGLWRVTPAGAVDPAFGAAGHVALRAASNNNGISLLGLPSGGIALLRGDVRTFFLDTVSATGVPQVSYDRTVDSGLFLLTSASAVDAQGRIVLAGGQLSGGSILLRFFPNGDPDTSFGPAGLRAYNDGTALRALDFDAQGRIVGLGNVSGQLTLMRWFDNGEYDPTLRSTGKAITAINGGGESLDIDPQGRAVFWVNGAAGYFIARYGAQIDVAGNDSLFVRQQYIDFLAREPDASGLAFWTGELGSGATTRAAMVSRFIESPEFQGSYAPVTRLYLATLGRFPDEGGLQFWVDQVLQGRPLEAIAGEFVGSAEFQATYGSLDTAGFVQRVYSNVLGRAADPDGLAYWSNQLDSGAITRAAMMLQFSESAEYRVRIRPSLFVYMTYRGLLRRAPDNGGASFWVSQLNAGTPEATMVQGFIDSTEYNARFGPI